MKNPNQSYRLASAMLGIALCPTALVWAAGAPDAGAIQQQMDRTLKQPAAPVTPAAKAAPAPAESQGQAQVTVSRFEFVGNTLIGSEALSQLSRDSLGKPLSLTDLRMVSEKVRQAYSDAGWMAQVFLPAQEIESGQVKIQIVEARLGQTVFTGAVPRVELSRLQALVGAQLNAGEPIRNASLERALMLLSDTPGVLTSANFMQGQQAGQTDLVVNVVNKPVVSGSAGLDNMGSKLTGIERLTGTLNIASPMGLGDLVSLSGLKTSGSDFVRAVYSLPVGADGWRLGAHASGMNYQTLAPNNFSGQATTYGLDVSYPIVRGQTRNLNFNGTLDNKAFRNDVAGVLASDYHITVANLGLSANAQDAWAGGGISSVALVLSGGQVSPTPLLSDASTQGQFRKWQLNLARMQTLVPGLTANVAWQLQRANKNLDSSEKLYLGGVYGVRAYPMSEGSAKDGEMLNVELSQQLPNDLVLSGFYDWAQARNPEATEAALRRYSLRGMGVSMTWQALSQWQIKATAARRLGDNPLPAATYGASRLWVSANYSF